MPIRRRFLVLVAVLTVVGASAVLAPSVSATSATDTTASAAPATAASPAVAFQPEAPPPERWNRTYGSTAGDLTAVAVDERGIVAAGTMLRDSGTSSSGWVVAVDPAGAVRFQETYATDGDGRFEDVVPTADGGYLLAGTLDSGNTAAGDGWVLKLDATGTVVWQDTLGGAGDDVFTAIQSTDDGYLLAGTKGGGSDTDGWLAKVTTGGRLAWDGSYDNGFDDRVRDIAPHPSGGYLLAGETTAFVGAPTDGWTVHVEADGSEVQQRVDGGQRTDGFHAVEVLDGDLLLAGTSGTYGTDERRGWVLRRGPNGTERWNRTYDVDGTDALATTDDGFVLAGIEETDAGIRDGVLVGAQVDGTSAWRRAYGRANDDLFADILVGQDGGYLLAGTSYSGPGDGTGWVVALGPVLRTTTPTPTVTAIATPGATAAPTAAGTTVTQTAGEPTLAGEATPAGETTLAGEATPAGEATRTPASDGSAIDTTGAVDGATTATNASAAGGGGSFPWALVALFLIVAVLGGVFLAIRSQRGGDTFGTGGDSGAAPSPPGDSDPTFGTPDGETQDGSAATSTPPSRGTPRDPDPLGTNARSPREAAKLFVASVVTWGRMQLSFLENPRVAESADSTGGTAGDTAGTGSSGTEPRRRTDEGGDQQASTVTDADTGVDGAESAGPEPGGSASSEWEVPTADAASPATDGQSGSSSPAAGTPASSAAESTGGGDPGTFTLRNPGDEPSVVAFRCQTANETLFNYYAELEPSAIKRARKLPPERPFQITIAITDGPSEDRLFQNDGPDGQDVTVTVAPDSIRMDVGADERSGATIEGTVEPEPGGDGQSQSADASAGLESDPEQGETDHEQADTETTSVSDNPDDVLPSADDSTDETVVGEDPDDVLPSATEAEEDAAEATTADADGTTTAESDEPTTTGTDETETVATAGDDSEGGDGDDSGGGSGFQALKEEFESGDADWAEEGADADGKADDADDPFAETDDDLGLGGDEFEDGLGLEDDFDAGLEGDFDGSTDGPTAESDDTESTDSGGSDDDGDKSFADLKEEFESGDAEWADDES